MPQKGSIRVPEKADAGGKMGISGPNVQAPNTPALPSHLGGKGGK